MKNWKVFSTNNDESENPGILCTAPVADQAVELTSKEDKGTFYQQLYNDGKV